MTEFDPSRQRLFALRGAITADANDEASVLSATRELIEQIIDRNSLAADQMVSCIFTATPDLDAQFPAVAARDLGLDSVPLLCTQEIAVPGALPKVIRVLLHYHAELEHRPQHVYLRDAQKLRADLTSAQ